MMDIAAMESAVGKLDRALRQIAERPVDISDPNWVKRLQGLRPLEEAGIKSEAETLLNSILLQYSISDESTRVAIRRLFDHYSSFRWASSLACTPTTAEGFRLHLLHLSVRDQGSDARDEILALRYLCAQATKSGVDIAPILNEVANLSSDVNKYGMGSTKGFLLNAC
jgi:hypothetical protein